MSSNTSEFRAPSSPPPEPISNPNISPQRQGLKTYGQNGQKEKRNPSITPRKFTRFFTPRSHGPVQNSASRQALYDITAPALNRSGIQSSPLQSSRGISGLDNSPVTFTRELKRRKLLHNPDEGNEKKLQNLGSLNKQDDLIYSSTDDDVDDVPSSPCDRSFPSLYEERSNYTFTEPPKRLIPVEDRGIGGRLLQLSLGGSARPTRRHFSYPVLDYQNETADFYSLPQDTHLCMSVDGPDRSIPFCTVSCNTNSLVAVGDEEGQVRLLESTKDGTPAFDQAFHSFRVHHNAIIDMVFSKDDSLLATASGDQTAKVVDMVTQTTLSILSNHSASLKQVRFQPGASNNSVLATSSRDGSVQIWDLRCKGQEDPVLSFHQSEGSRSEPGARRWTNAYAINSIRDAHKPLQNLRTAQMGNLTNLVTKEVLPRVTDISVTSIAFLQPGQEHLLLTASEADASVKLWDIRAQHNGRRKTAVALSQTKQPENHSQWRHFGISSLNVNSKGDRFYALCKDNTVYAYSTSHLMFGHAPELSSRSRGRPRPQQETDEGLGPIYGFRHPQMHATSFYVKAALREAKDGRSEMLAVGSSDGCAVLFPTDERYLKDVSEDNKKDTEVPDLPQRSRRRPGLPQRSTSLSLSRADDSVLISRRGTPLIRGHDREVGALNWTNEGNLITVGDDFLIRCWREGSSNARKLRVLGEQSGRRWACGWADVEADFDGDDDDDDDNNND